MNENQRNRVVLLSVLGVVIAVVFWYQFFRTPSLATPEAAASVPAAQVANVGTVESVFQEAEFDIEELAQSIKDVEFNYAEAREVRDPMIPLLGGTSFIPFEGAKGDEAVTPVDVSIIYEANRKSVTGIIWDESFPLAVLSELGEPDEIVSEGFEIGGGIRVTSIHHNHVVLALQLENETMEIVKELKEQ